MFLRTTTATVETPASGVDAFGDSAPTWSVSASGVGAHITEQSQRVFVPAEDRWTVRRDSRLLLDPGTVLAKGDRVTLASGSVFHVKHVYDDDQGLLPKPVRADLERVTG